MAYVKQEKQFSDAEPFDLLENKVIEGKFIGEKTLFSSKYGEFKVLEFDVEGERKSIVKYTALKYYDWSKCEGKMVRISYLGQEVNENTGRDFYNFSVEVDEEELNEK